MGVIFGIPGTTYIFYSLAVLQCYTVFSLCLSVDNTCCLMIANLLCIYIAVTVFMERPKIILLATVPC